MVSPHLLLPAARSASSLASNSPLLVENTEPHHQRRDSFLTAKEYKHQRAQQQLQRPSARLQPTGLQHPVATSAADPNLASEFDERSLLRQTGDVALDTVGGLGNLIDVPGGVVRDVLTWLPGGPTPHNPLDNLLPWNWGSSDARISGEQFLEDYGLLDDSGDPKGLGTTLGRMGAGIGLEVLLDPLTYITAGAWGAMKGVTKGAMAARSLKKIGLLDDADIYAKAAGLVSDTGGEIGKREALTKMSARGFLDNPMNRSGEDAAKVTEKLHGAFEGALSTDKAFRKSVERAGVKPGTAEYAKMLDEVTNANLAETYLRWRLPGGIVDKAIPGTGRRMDEFAARMRYSGPVLSAMSKMSKTFEGKSTKEMQKAVRESKRVLQQDFVVAREEMFDNVTGIEEQLGNLPKSLSPEEANARRNEIGNYMREYLEDIYPSAGKRERLVTTDEDGIEHVAEQFTLGRDELFEYDRNKFAQNFIDKLNGVQIADGDSFRNIDPDVIDRVKKAIPYMDNMKDQMDALVGKAADMKIDMSQLIDTEATYFPRLRQTSKGVITGRFGSKLRNLEPDNPFAIRRKDYLRNIPGGTAVLNRMSTDSNFAGRGSSFARNSNKVDVAARREMKADFDKAYAHGLSEEQSDELFDMIVSLPKEDVDKQVAMFNVNPAESALKALESAYSARSQADILRTVLQDNIYVKPRNLQTLEREIRAAGKETTSAGGAADLASGVVGQAARGTDESVGDVASRVQVEREIPPPAGTRAVPAGKDGGGGSGGKPSTDGDGGGGGGGKPDEDDPFGQYTTEGNFADQGFRETAGETVHVEVTDDGVKSVEDVALYNPETGEMSVAVKDSQGETISYKDYSEDMYTVVSKPADDATEAAQDSFKSEADWERFVADGTVPDGMLDDIATKMANGENLSSREVDVRNANADEFEAILNAKKESAEASQAGSKKATNSKKPRGDSDGWVLLRSYGADGKKKPHAIYTHPDGWVMKIIDDVKRPAWIRPKTTSPARPTRAADDAGKEAGSKTPSKPSSGIDINAPDASQQMAKVTREEASKLRDQLREVEAEIDKIAARYLDGDSFLDDLPGGEEAYVRYEELVAEQKRLAERSSSLYRRADDIDRMNADDATKVAEDATKVAEDVADSAVQIPSSESLRAEAKAKAEKMREIDAEMESIADEYMDRDRRSDFQVDKPGGEAAHARYRSLEKEANELAEEAARLTRKAEAYDKMDAEEAIEKAFQSYTKPHDDYEEFLLPTGPPIEVKVNALGFPRPRTKTVQQYNPNTREIRVGNNNTPDDDLVDYELGEYEILSPDARPTGPGSKATKAVDEAGDVEDVIGDITPEAAADLARIERANEDAIKLGYTSDELSNLDGEVIEYIASNSLTKSSMHDLWVKRPIKNWSLGFNAYLPRMIKNMKAGVGDAVDADDSRGIFERLENVSVEDLAKDKKKGGSYSKADLVDFAKGLGLRTTHREKKGPLAEKIHDAVKARKSSGSKADRSKLPVQTTTRPAKEGMGIEALVSETRIMTGEASKDAFTQTGHWLGQGRTKFLVKIPENDLSIEVVENVGVPSTSTSATIAGDVKMTLNRAAHAEPAKETGFRDGDGLQDIRFSDDQREVIVPAELVDLIRDLHPEVKFHTTSKVGNANTALVARVGDNTVGSIVALESKSHLEQAAAAVRTAHTSDAAVTSAIKTEIKHGSGKEQARQRLFDDIEAIRGNEEATAAMAIFDAVAKTWAGKTGKDIGLFYKRLGVKYVDKPDIEDVPVAGQNTVGRLDFLTDADGSIEALGDFLIVLSSNATRATLIHEMAHMFRLTMGEADPALLARLERSLGSMLPDGSLFRTDLKVKRLSVAAEEMWSQGFEQFLRTGEAPTEELKSVYKVFSEWLKDVYKNLSKSLLKKQLPDDLKQIYRELQGAPALKKKKTAAPPKTARKQTASQPVFLASKVDGSVEHIESAVSAVKKDFFHTDATVKPKPLTPAKIAEKVSHIRDAILPGIIKLLDTLGVITDGRVIMKLGKGKPAANTEKRIKAILKDKRVTGGDGGGAMKIWEKAVAAEATPLEIVAFKNPARFSTSGSEVIFRVTGGKDLVQVDKSYHDLIRQHHPNATAGYDSSAAMVVYKDKDGDVVAGLKPFGYKKQNEQRAFKSKLANEVKNLHPDNSNFLAPGSYTLDNSFNAKLPDQRLRATAPGQKPVNFRAKRDAGSWEVYAVEENIPVALKTKVTKVGTASREHLLAGELTASQAGQFLESVVESIARAGRAGLPEFDEAAGLSRGSSIESLKQTVNVRTSANKLKRYGLPIPPGKKRHKTRVVAQALQTYYRKRYKGAPIAKDDFTTPSSRRIANWMIEEVEFANSLALENPLRSAVGWYSKKWPKSLDNLSEVFPEFTSDSVLQSDLYLQFSDKPGLQILENKKNARSFMTAITAVLSDGTKVPANFNEAALVYDNFRNTGFIDDTVMLTGQAKDNKQHKLRVLQRLLETYGPSEMHHEMLEKMKISELKELVEKTGEKVASGYKVDTVMPAATAYLGPKLGVFYANLMGQSEYLTMDRWWSRTFHRYRGTLIPLVGKDNMVKFKVMLSESGVIKKPASRISDDEAISEAAHLAKRNKELGFQSKIHRDLRDKMLTKANGINKRVNDETLDQPYNGSDRDFMIETTERAQESLKKKGIDLSIADIQATLWYYEKELYGELGAIPTQAISYEEISRQTAAHVHASRNNAGRPLDTVNGTEGSSGFLNRIDDPETPGSSRVESLKQTISTEEAESLTHFSDDAHRGLEWETEGKGTTKLIFMEPTEFLRMAEKLPHENVASKAAIERRMQAGQPLGSIPLLTIKNNGDGVAEVVGHEGRHRAAAFARRGMTLPVRLNVSHGEVIRWSLQDVADSYDRVKGVWPQRLVTQNAGSGDAIPFPVSDPLARIESLRQTTSGPAIQRDIFDQSDPKRIAARVSMPSEEWATSPQKTILTAFDATTGEDFAEAISDLFIAEQKRMSPEMSKIAEDTYRLSDGDWDTPVQRGNLEKTARQWLAEDFRKWAAGDIRAPIGAEGYFGKLKDYSGKLFAKFGRDKVDDMGPELGKFFDQLLGDSITGDLTSLNRILDDKSGVGYANTPHKVIERQSLLAMLPAGTKAVARENALVDNWARASDEFEELSRSAVKTPDGQQVGAIEAIEEQIAEIEEAIASSGGEPSKSVARKLEKLQAKITPPPKDYEEWLAAYKEAGSPSERFMGVSTSVSDDRLLAQVSLPKHLAEDIVTINQGIQFLQDERNIGGLFRWYDSYNSLFKTNVTSTNPGFHVRNFFSGFIQNALNDVHDPRFGVLDPKQRRFTQHYSDIRGLMRGKVIEGISDIPLFKGLNDKEATEKFAEMLFNYKIIENPGTARDLPGVGPGSISSQLIGPRFGQSERLIGLNPKNLLNDKTFVGQRSSQVPVTKSRAAEMNKVEQAAGKVRDSYKRLVNVAQNIGDVVEIQHRAGAVLALLRQGYSPDEAARVAKLLQVDYSNLSTFEREVLRRIFPFYSFSRGMAVYLAKELTTRPAGKVGLTIRAQRHATDKDVATPSHISRGLSIPLGSNADGTRHYLTNIGLMHEQPAQQISPFINLNPSDSLFSTIGNMNPLLKIIPELAYDESTFQQSVSGGVDLDDADPSLGRAISNIGQSLGLRDMDRRQPVRLGKLTEVAVGASPASRYINTARTLFDTRKEGPFGLLARGVNSMSGLRVTSVSPAKQDAVLRERAEQFLQSVGARHFQKSYIPEEVRANMSPEELAAVQQYEQLIEILAKRSKERRKNKEKE